MDPEKNVPYHHLLRANEGWVALTTVMAFALVPTVFLLSHSVPYKWMLAELSTIPTYPKPDNRNQSWHLQIWDNQRKPNTVLFSKFLSELKILLLVKVSQDDIWFAVLFPKRAEVERQSPPGVNLRAKLLNPSAFLFKEALTNRNSHCKRGRLKSNRNFLRDLNCLYYLSITQGKRVPLFNYLSSGTSEDELSFLQPHSENTPLQQGLAFPKR